MSDEEKTDPAGPFAIVMRRLLEDHERTLLRRLDEFEKRVLIANGAYEHRVRECEREISNLKEIVYGDDFQRVLRFARAAIAETEPPPTERAT